MSKVSSDAAVNGELRCPETGRPSRNEAPANDRRPELNLWSL
jgi:hypothetical protein